MYVEVRDTFGKQFRIVGGTIAMLERVTGELQKEARRIEIKASERKRQIAESLATLKRELEDNSGREIAIISTSKTVNAGISDMVIALQTHDIVTQRLEHTRKALSGALQHLQDNSAGSVQQAAQVAAIQLARLHGVQADLRKPEHALSSAVTDIRVHVNVGENECLLAKEVEHVTATGNGSVQLSLEMLADVDALISEVVRCSREFYDFIEPVGRLTTGLTGALEQLANKMRMIALNAQVQAVQIGDGTGLEVLAAHAAGVSADTSGLAESIANDIERLVGTTSETLFFRDRCPFDALAQEVIPEIMSARKCERTLNIWSAASSSGQEAYSIAMLLRENFPELRSWTVRITGTDISQTVLAQARTGVYAQHEVNRPARAVAGEVFGTPPRSYMGAPPGDPVHG